MSAFKPGDVVRLKSGGPKMTVQNSGTNLGVAFVSCSWFDDKNKLEHGDFEPNSLEIYVEPAVGSAAPHKIRR